MARAYRHDIRCPHCGSNGCKKNGHANGKQTSLCKDCFHRFTPEARRHVFPERLKQEAARMYCEGTGIAAIGRILGVPLGTTYSWIKKSRVGTRCRPEANGSPEVVGGGRISLDEMWTYANVRTGPNRNSVWIWTAVVDEEKVVIEVGDRSEESETNRSARRIRLCDRLPATRTPTRSTAGFRGISGRSARAEK